MPMNNPGMKIHTLGRPVAWTLVAVLFCPLAGIAGTHPVIVKNTPANHIAEEVLHNLLATPMGRAVPPCSWQVVLVEDRHVNAFGTPNAQVTVTTGMAWILGNDPGAWAAVLGHEIGHFVIHRSLSAYLPGFQAEVKKAYLQTPDSQSIGGEPSGLRLVSLGGGPINLRLSREREYEADHVGLLLMAQAGYHPDFVIAVQRRFRALLGDQTRFDEFFATHPRWAAREEHTMRAYDAALAIFDSGWPDPARSPGGPPPALGTIGPLIARQSSEDQSVVLHVPVRIRNAAGRARVEAIFLDGGRRLQTAAPEYRSADGSLVLNAAVPNAAAGELPDVVLRLPAAALPPGTHKLKTMVFLMAGDGIVDIASRSVEMSISRR